MNLLGVSVFARVMICYHLGGVTGAHFPPVSSHFYYRYSNFGRGNNLGNGLSRMALTYGSLPLLETQDRSGQQMPALTTSCYSSLLSNINPSLQVLSSSKSFPPSSVLFHPRWYNTCRFRSTSPVSVNHHRLFQLQTLTTSHPSTPGARDRRPSHPTPFLALPQS